MVRLQPLLIILWFSILAAVTPFLVPHHASQQCRVAKQNGSLILHANQQQSTAETKEEKELTPPIIAEMIEVSFLNSCLQLSQGYVDVLKLFIVAVKSGHELSISLSGKSALVLFCRDL